MNRVTRANPRGWSRAHFAVGELATGADALCAPRAPTTGRRARRSSRARSTRRRGVARSRAYDNSPSCTAGAGARRAAGASACSWSAPSARWRTSPSAADRGAWPPLALGATSPSSTPCVAPEAGGAVRGAGRGARPARGRRDLGPPAEVDVLAVGPQLGLEASERYREVGPDQQEGAVDGEHVSHGVVLFLVEFTGVDEGRDDAGLVDGQPRGDDASVLSQRPASARSHPRWTGRLLHEQANRRRAPRPRRRGRTGGRPRLGPCRAPRWPPPPSRVGGEAAHEGFGSHRRHRATWGPRRWRRSSRGPTGRLVLGGERRQADSNHRPGPGSPSRRLPPAPPAVSSGSGPRSEAASGPLPFRGPCGV